MRRKRVLKIVLWCVIASVFLLTAAFMVERRRAQAEFGAVLSAYLSDEIVHDFHDCGSGRGITVVLQREAQLPATWRFRQFFLFDQQAHFPDASFVTRASFVINNTLPSPIHIQLHLPPSVNVVVASSRELQGGLGGDFEQRFPHNLGYIAVTRAGFSGDKTEALFYVDHFCGLCGGGAYILMRKVNGVWVVVSRHGTWVS